MMRELQLWFPESLQLSFLPTAEWTSDVQESDKHVQENDTNLAEAQSKRPMYKKTIRMYKKATQIWQRLRLLTACSVFACSHFAQRILPTPKSPLLCGGERGCTDCDV